MEGTNDGLMDTRRSPIKAIDIQSINQSINDWENYDTKTFCVDSAEICDRADAALQPIGGRLAGNHRHWRSSHSRQVRIYDDNVDNIT